MNRDDIAELVRGQIADAAEAIGDAQMLLANRRGGRTIVNRSYYAMYYCVRALLQTIGQVPRRHSGAISLFDRHFIHSGHLPRELSADLHRIFDRRQVDDYERSGPVSLDEARDALAAAERFVDAVRQYLIGTGFLA